MRGAAESLIRPHAPVITHVWPGSRPPRTRRGVTRLSGRAEPGRQCPPRPTEQPRGREGGSRAARTPQQGGRHFWKSWLNKRSPSAGAMGGALLGVPQQGGREQLCLLQLFKHSASLLSVRPARIHTFNISFSRMWVVLIHASISTSISLPPVC